MGFCLFFSIISRFAPNLSSSVMHFAILRTGLRKCIIFGMVLVFFSHSNGIRFSYSSLSTVNSDDDTIEEKKQQTSLPENFRQSAMSEKKDEGF